MKYMSCLASEMIFRNSRLKISIYPNKCESAYNLPQTRNNLKCLRIPPWTDRMQPIYLIGEVSISKLTTTLINPLIDLKNTDTRTFEFDHMSHITDAWAWSMYKRAPPRFRYYNEAKVKEWIIAARILLREGNCFAVKVCYPYHFRSWIRGVKCQG